MPAWSGGFRFIPTDRCPDHIRSIGSRDWASVSGQVSWYDMTFSYWIALADLARSRRANFWILPVEVFGSSPNTNVFGTLKPARWLRQ